MFAAAISLMASAQVLQAQSETANEYDVKAAFLYNFAKFIEWPGTSANDPDPMAICIYGDDPFGRALDEIVKGKAIDNREIVVRRTHHLDDIRNCQIVFVSATESGHLSEIIASLQGLSVLLVGDTPGFAEHGGHIEFTTEENRVRFSINVDASERSGLRMSSKLLALAKIIHADGRVGKS